jgi:transposase
LFGVSISPGLVVKLQNIITESTRPAYDDLVCQLPNQPAVNVDETPTRERNGNAWIWTVVAAQFTVFAVRLTKAACVIRNLLGEGCTGVDTSDRAKMYDFFTALQWRWAHLKRDFEFPTENAPGQARQVAQKLLILTNTLFHHWHRVRDGTILRVTFQRHLRPLDGQIYLTLEEGTLCTHRQTAAMGQNLLDRYDNLFEFARNPVGLVEPTNNAAERALRHPVIWKQLSFGTQSAAGSRFVETLLTVTETRDLTIPR